MVASIDIGSRKVGPGQPCFIIAEAGVNHNGSLETAMRLVDAAAVAGADAVKFQTFKAERLVTTGAPKADYQLRNTGIDESQYEMLRRLELSEEAHKALRAYCQDKGIVFLSTPFDEEDADLLDVLGVPAFKIPSGEITNIPFLEYVVRKGKPMVVSTGMSTLEEVEVAVEAIRRMGNRDLVLLQCVSSYPASPEDVNLRAMNTMAERFGLPVGFSDHTLGIEVALAAVALGACVIEKHFTLDRNLPGPDHRASLEPDELAGLVRGIRVVEMALGSGRKKPAPCEANAAAVARKSLVAARDIRAGTKLTADLITAKRPGTGLAPAVAPDLVGRTLRVGVQAGTILSKEMFE